MRSPDPHDYPVAKTQGDRGTGLIATEDLAPGRVVARFEGPVLRREEVPENEICYALVLDAVHWLVPRSMARYLNHACDPNCYVLDSGEVATLRAVARGEELTFDYALVSAEEYFADPAAHAWDVRWDFACRCGSAHCRGAIDGYTIVGSARAFPPMPPLRIGMVSGKGRGTFATRLIHQGERIERAPVMVIPGSQWSQVEHTVLYDYVFEWGDDDQDAALVLGVASLINHSPHASARFVRRHAELEMDFVAVRDIAPGEEVTINYHGDPQDSSPVWFAAVE